MPTSNITYTQNKAATVFDRSDESYAESGQRAAFLENQGMTGMKGTQKAMKNVLKS